MVPESDQLMPTIRNTRRTNARAGGTPIRTSSDRETRRIGLSGIILGLLLAIVLLLGCGHESPTTPQERLDRAINELNKAGSSEERFYALDDAAKESFLVGRTDEARKYAEELLAMLPQFKDNWNYGNGVQDGNLVLGRIAVREGRIDDGKRYLIEAGKSPGSPQMDSFGPNMSLAKDLLEKGDREVVLEYFELCRKFWKMGRDDLDRWSADVKAGKTPDFGANLIY